MMKHVLRLLRLWLAAALLPIAAQAYVLTTNGSGQILTWPAPAEPTYYTRWLNTSGLSYSQIFTVFTNSLQRWKYAGSGSLTFDYWQGSNSGTPATVANDGRNAIFFSSQSSQKLANSVIGITYVYSSGGRILDTDIEFNDENFVFTTVASDSSAFGDHRHVYLENVATHEIGHSLGLSHSAVLQSTMVYLEYRAQAKPSCDDIAALGALYPLSSFTSGRGSVSGTVKNGATNVFGAHVMAISATRGTVVESVVSQGNGTFSIPNLEPGAYYLLVEPFNTTSPLDSLCGDGGSGCYYGTVNSQSTCSGNPFKRGFVESSAGTPQLVTVTSGLNTALGTYSVSCSTMAGVTPSLNAAGAPTLLSNNSGAYAIASNDAILLNTDGSHYFKLVNVSGTISAKVLSYSVYSKLDPEVTILDSGGVTEAAGVSKQGDVFTNSSAFTNYDTAVTLSNASAGNYYVKITDMGSPQIDRFPAGSSTSDIDSTRYYLLVVTINDATTLVPSTASPTMTANARCEATDGFTSFLDHGPPAPISASSTSSSPPASSSSSESKSSGCSFGLFGTLSGPGGGGRHDSGPPGPDALFSVWGIALMLMMGRLLQLASRAVRR